MNKKLLVGLLFAAGVAGAACIGPFCWDENGAYVNGLTVDGTGHEITSMTLATMNSTSPRKAGMLIRVSDGVQSKLCISSGTLAGAYTVLQSTAPGAGALQHCS